MSFAQLLQLLFIKPHLCPYFGARKVKLANKPKTQNKISIIAALL